MMILAYHGIGHDGRRYSVSPDNFWQQLQVLQTYCRPVSLTELLNGRSPSKPTDTRVAITLDDGYGDNFTSALPLLIRAAVPATFFIVSGHVGSSREFWWDELEWLLFHTKSEKDRIETQIAGMHLVWNLDADEDKNDRGRSPKLGPKIRDVQQTPRERAYWALHDVLRVSSPACRLKILDSLAASMNVNRQVRVEKLPITHEQLQCLAEHPLVEIGAHTIQHIMLPAFPSAVQDAEIVGSKRDLEEMSGQPILSFAYPYGAYSDETVKAVESAGFARACTVRVDSVRDQDRFRLPRLMPGNCGAETFARELYWIVSRKR